MLIIETALMSSPGAISHTTVTIFGREISKVKEKFFYYKFFLTLSGGFESFSAQQNACTAYFPGNITSSPED
jgi:hypothetical protein